MMTAGGFVSQVVLQTLTFTGRVDSFIGRTLQSGRRSIPASWTNSPFTESNPTARNMPTSLPFLLWKDTEMSLLWQSTGLKVWYMTVLILKMLLFFFIYCYFPTNRGCHISRLVNQKLFIWYDINACWIHTIAIKYKYKLDNRNIKI